MNPPIPYPQTPKSLTGQGFLVLEINGISWIILL